MNLCVWSTSLVSSLSRNFSPEMVITGRCSGLNVCATVGGVIFGCIRHSRKDHSTAIALETVTRKTRSENPRSRRNRKGLISEDFPQIRSAFNQNRFVQGSASPGDGVSSCDFQHDWQNFTAFS